MSRLAIAGKTLFSIAKERDNVAAALQGFQQMEPACGPQSSAALLQSARHRGHGYTRSHPTWTTKECSSKVSTRWVPWPQSTIIRTIPSICSVWGLKRRWTGSTSFIIAVMVPTGSPLRNAMNDCARQNSKAGFTSGLRVATSSRIRGEDWGRQQGMTHMIGPMGFSDMDHEGMLIEGFDQMGTMATIYNRPRGAACLYTRLYSSLSAVG